MKCEQCDAPLAVSHENYGYTASGLPNIVADRLLRLMVVTKAPVADYSLDALADLQDKSTPTRMKLYASPKDWRAEVAA